MLRRLLLYLSARAWMRRAFTRYRVTRNFAWRFVAGETTSTALDAVRELQGKRIQATLDLLGESVRDAGEAERSTESYLCLLDEIERSGLSSHISIKLTQLGLDVSDETCEENLRRLLLRARDHGIFVRFDMEGSAYTERTLAMYRKLHEEFDGCGVVIQSYLHRSLRDVEELNSIGGRVRLCKGAYLEPDEIAYQDKHDVDANYIRLMEMLLSEGSYPAIATHDTSMISHALRYVRTYDIPRAAFEFQMLYGVRRDLQERLAGEGYNVRCYVPFGSEWYPYFMRRLAERPANLMFVLRNLIAELRKR